MNGIISVTSGDKRAAVDVVVTGGGFPWENLTGQPFGLLFLLVLLAMAVALIAQAARNRRLGKRVANLDKTIRGLAKFPRATDPREFERVARNR